MMECRWDMRPGNGRSGIFRPVLKMILGAVLCLSWGFDLVAGQLRGRVGYRDGGPCVGCKVVIEVKGLKKELEAVTNAGGRFALDWTSDRPVKKLWVDGKKVRAKFPDPLRARIQLKILNPQIEDTVKELKKLVEGNRYKLLWKMRPRVETRTAQQIDLESCTLIYETKRPIVARIMPGVHDLAYIPLAKVRSILPEGEFEGCATVVIPWLRKEILIESRIAGANLRDRKVGRIAILLKEPEVSENAERLAALIKRLAAYCGNPIR